MRQACRWLCPQKKKEGRGKGVQYGGRGMGVESRPDAREKEKHTVHKDDECGTRQRPRENGDLKGANTDGVHRACSETIWQA